MALSKRLRFEVFKRDSFTCQYCGKKAPDVVLHVDHIHPRAEGGTDDLLNLTTACGDCNLGKAAKLLSDDSVVNKQRAQMEALQERQEQIQMMIDWHRSLSNLDQDTVDKIGAHWCELADWHGLSEYGRDKMAKLVRRFGAEPVLESMRIAAGTYFKYEGAATSATKESANEAFNKIGGICKARTEEAKRPYLKDFYYTRAIIRNRVADGQITYWNHNQFESVLREAYEAGADADDMHDIAKTCTSWTGWRNYVVEYTNQLRKAGP